MWRVRTVVSCASLLAVVALALAPARASTADATLRLTASGEETGWVSLAVSSDRDAPVEVRELIGDRAVAVARLTPRFGTSERRHAVRWRCSRQTRRFEATAPGGRTASATIATPGCVDRLRMIVVPARVRPGQEVSVRVSDTWRLGEIAAKICARPAAAAPCRRVSIPGGARTGVARVRLRGIGRRTIGLRTAFGQELSAPVEVRRRARLRVLVTGDSLSYAMTFGLALDLGDRATVLGDTHPGRGITTPGGFLDWPAHARRVAHTAYPDVTIVVLGSADGGYPLTAPTGEAVACCDPPWVAAYANIASAMMASYLRDGRGLVYWVALPAPRSPAKATVLRAENDAIRRAAAAHDDGVRVIERVAGVLAPGDRYHESILFRGREVVVRDADGVHLTQDGNRIATGILQDALRGDGLLR